MSDDVIHDWNLLQPNHQQTPDIELHDETLRDGIQCPSVQDPSIDDKLAILRLLDQLGVDTADIGLPGAGPRAVEDVTVMTEMVRDEKLSIQLGCAARIAYVARGSNSAS